MAFSLIGIFAVAGGKSNAQELTYIRADCGNFVSPVAKLHFDNAEHAAWYRRFWTGECQGLPIFSCMAGTPNWNSMVGQFLAKSRPETRDLVAKKACRLGELIGFEWAKDNSIRRISTNDLPDLLALAQNDPDVSNGLDRASSRVNNLLNGR